ncbi:MAG: transpeptidase family protein [Leptospiraceae bacterium]|nr:transpeptidase family protein [Leptospiraceae bacterium]MCB1302815.1 transpeptidase family protein [Leptospiraceae bacterium]
MERAQLRLVLFAALLSLCFGIALGRVGYLVWQGRGWRTQPDTETVRGPILDRRGITLALTEEASTIGLAPEEMADPEFTAQQVARFIEMPQADILRRYYLYRDRKYFLLKRQVDNFAAERLMELQLPGVHRDFEYRRVYPSATLASNLLGFVGQDATMALEGIERDYNSVLLQSYGEPRGPSLYLTIDSLIQYRMEQALAKGFERSDAKRAVGLFMHIPTGEVLAMASLPNFDPNQYNRYSASERGNWAIRLNYEPGSTVKVLMASILLSSSHYQPGKKYVCNGEYDFKTGTVRCLRGGHTFAHGALTLEDIIRESCNVGMIKAMQAVPKEELFRKMQALGLGQRTGILPEGSGETEGYLPSPENWVESTRFYYPIGQGFSVTPIQLLRAASVIGNDGSLVRPRIVRRIVTEDGRSIEESKTSVEATPFQPEALRKIRAMMRLVVTSGTGKAANIPEVRIIGKTGTGQKSSASGYTNRYAVSFLGMFPEDNPEYIGLILYDDVSGQWAGGSLAAPVFKEFVESILPIIRAPRKTYEAHRFETEVHHPTEGNTDRLADFTGMSAIQALELIGKKYKLPVQFSGSGTVFKQEPPPGTPIERINKIILYLDSRSL